MNVHDREAEVEVRGKRLRANDRELRVLGGARKADRPGQRQRAASAPRGRRRASCSVIGSTVDEASTGSKSFSTKRCSTSSDGSAISRIRHGTAETEAASAILQEHPLVAASRCRAPKQGGGGRDDRDGSEMRVEHESWRDLKRFHQILL